MTLQQKKHATGADRIDWNLTNHAPAPEQIEAIERLRQWAKDLGYQIDQRCPESREKSLALTALEETVMWAVAAVARAIVEPPAKPCDSSILCPATNHIPGCYRAEPSCSP